jgi:arylsulfatase A-like enzyme
VTVRRSLSMSVVLAALSLSIPSCSVRPPRPNIAIIVLDTVRRDATGVGSQVGGRESVTPALDQLAAEGTGFTKAFANAPWTVPSHASMFTGLLPSVHGCPSKTLKLTTKEPTFAEILRDAGYETEAFYSNPFLTREMTGMMRGFDSEHVSGDPRTFGALNRSDQGGEESIRDVSEWLGGRSSERPFLVFLNVLEAHMPYDPPDDYRQSRLSDLPHDAVVTSDWELQYDAGLYPQESVDWERLGRLYAGDVHHADDLLGEFLGLLKKNGVYDDTVVIVVSDHGENLGDHGLVGHRFSVHSSLLAVPLVIRAPGRLPSGVRHDPVMLTDIFATVLDLAGIERAPLPPYSRSLLSAPTGEPRPLVAEYSGEPHDILNRLHELNPDLDTRSIDTALATVRLGEMRLTIGSDGSALLHDLTEDPGQRHDVSDDHPEVVSMLKGLLVKVVRNPGQLIELDEGMRQWLRSLGYVG